MPKKLTTEIFIERATEKYGKNRFDYSETSYKGSKVNVTIRCIKCNETFSTRPVSHLNASIDTGCCPSCLKIFEKGKKAAAMREKYADSKEDFVRKANQLWNGMYDYSKVEYVNNRTKVIVRCKKHKIEYEVTPGNHLVKPGCKECKRDSIVQALSFSQKAYEQICNEVHDYEYEYGEYTGAHEKIKIKCLIHGWFEQIANDHRNGSKCPKCAFTSRGEKIALTHQEFVERSRVIHNFEYSYEKTAYKRSNIPVIITCSKHGDFEQLPVLHLEGRGCQRCSRENQAKEQTKSTESFIEDAKKIHGDKYTYENTNYVSAKTPLLIGCPKHGQFEQVPNYHLSGNGCPECGQESGGRDGLIHFVDNESWANSSCKLYFVHVGKYQKIGIAKDIQEREKSGNRKYGIIDSWSLRRAEAWCVEQYFLRLTLDKKPEKLDESFILWAGRTELRQFNKEELKDLQLQLESKVDEAKRKGWLDFATDNLVRLSPEYSHTKYI